MFERHCIGCCAVNPDPDGEEEYVSPSPMCPGIPRCEECREKDATIALLINDLRRCIVAGDEMSLLFETHWTVKDTDEAVHKAVSRWRSATAVVQNTTSGA